MITQETLHIILVFIAVIFILLSLYREWFGPSFTFMLAIAFLGICKIITPQEILHGFANEQVAIIILLLLYGDIIRRTSIIERIFDKLFHSARSYKGFLSRMMLIVASLSSMLNNTPLVAIMMPYVHNWCKKNNYSPSKFLIPLSFAAILGGSITLIGTSTNLIVSSMVEDQDIIPDLKSIEMFDFAAVGIPMLVLGFFYILIFGEKMLPERIKINKEYKKTGRDYLIETRVRHSSSLIGKTIESANLASYKGLYLVEVIRDSENLQLTENVEIEEDDILVFAGDNAHIADLIDSNDGLVISELGMFVKKKQARVKEIVISQNSILIGKNVQTVNFRAKYDATVLAVHRNGEQVTAKLDTVTLRAGDVLLIYAGINYDSRALVSQDFYFLTEIEDKTKVENYKVYIMLVGLVTTIVLSALNILNLFIGLVVLLLIALLFKITTAKELPRSIDYNLAIIIVMSLALGTAMIETKAADLIADSLIKVFMPLGTVGVLFAVYLITTILAAYITNKASVGIIFPIALSLAVNLGVSATPFVLTVAFASAANFMTPIGYQTNLMVYGPGGYTFTDFFKIGWPLTLIYMVTTVVILSSIYLW